MQINSLLTKIDEEVEGAISEASSRIHDDDKWKYWN